MHNFLEEILRDQLFCFSRRVAFGKREGGYLQVLKKMEGGWGGAGKALCHGQYLSDHGSKTLWPYFDLSR